MSNEPYDFGKLYFTIAGPLFLSGILGLVNGVINWPFFIAMLVALFVILRVVNALDKHSQPPPPKRRRR